MGLNILESILFGFISGLTDILPVSMQAHKLLMLKFFGISQEPTLMRFMIHAGIFASLYYHSLPQIVKIVRAKSLARIPKRRRKRPLDTKSLMDLRLWLTMLVPVVLVYCFYGKITALHSSLPLMAVFLFLNGVILYVPQFLPGSNKDSRSLSRVEGLLMGLGGAVSVLPGLSGVGTAVSVASVCGVDRSYGLNMVLLMNMAITFVLIVFDVLAMIAGGIGVFSFGSFLVCILSAAAAFLGTGIAIRIMRTLAAENGYALFACYCWAVALFTFLLNLMA